jgi:hypothetical protein
MAELGFLLRENTSVVVLIFGLVATFFVAQAWMTGQASGARAEESGEVVRFGAYDNYASGGLMVFVSVRTAEGRLLGLIASPDSLADCRIGSRIRLVRRGAILAVAPRGCVPSSST